MALVMTLLPDGTGFASANWSAVNETHRHQCLDDDNGDTSYVRCSTDSVAMTITYANPDDVTSANSGVAEAEIESITSVQFRSSGRSNNRRNAALVNIAFQTPSGFSETCSYDPHASSHETINGTTREEKPDTNDWEYSDLENLAMICTKLGTEEVYLGYLALKVIYEPAVAADNATFFGANF